MYHQEIETMPQEKLQQFQAQRLQEILKCVYENVPFYRDKFDQEKIKPANITSIKALGDLPFTTKSDLRDHYPFGLFAVPREQVVRLHASSGTTGKPTVVGYTQKDLQTWSSVCARSLVQCGVKQGQVFQNAYGYGLFTGGLGMHYGAEEIGLSTIPISGGNTARQIMIMQDFGTEVLACTPSYALTLSDHLTGKNVSRDKLKIKTFILGAEPWTEAMREEIESKLQVDAINIYGLSEIIGPGVSCECVEAKNGAHICEDHFALEVISSETGEILPDGEIGELVFTTLSKEALPLIRYRTGDLASITRDVCKCGRTHARMSRVIGRVDDMLIIRGVNVFPSQIESALAGISNITPHYQIIVSRKERLDQLEVHIEVSKAFFEEAGMDNFEKENFTPTNELKNLLGHKIKNTLGLSVEISLFAPGKIARSEGGKLSRVVDKRN